MTPRDELERGEGSRTICGELEGSFSRMRSALASETDHEGDIVRFDLDELEELIYATRASGARFKAEGQEPLLLHLGAVRDESSRLHVSIRGQILAELSILEATVKSWTLGSPPDLPMEQTLDRGRRKTSHAYFLSYSRENAAQADHLESLLYREGRTVLRDEAHFRAGRDLNESVSQRVREANTFLALWSRSYKASEWCRGELSYAGDLISSGKIYLRMVILTLDKEEIPPRFSASLRLSGRDRSRREVAVLKLIGEEEDSSAR